MNATGNQRRNVAPGRVPNQELLRGATKTGEGELPACACARHTPWGQKCEFLMLQMRRLFRQSAKLPWGSSRRDSNVCVW